MIKIVHKKNYEKSKGTARFIITYTKPEIILGVLLFLVNISASLIIFNFTLRRFHTYFDYSPASSISASIIDSLFP